MIPPGRQVLVPNDPSDPAPLPTLHVWLAGRAGAVARRRQCPSLRWVSGRAPRPFARKLHTGREGGVRGLPSPLVWASNQAPRPFTRKRKPFRERFS